MKTKTLGLLLLPLVPLTAIGIVEVAGAIGSLTAPPSVTVVDGPAPTSAIPTPPLTPPAPAPAE